MAAPANDLYVNAQLLTGLYGTITGTTVDATLDTPYDYLDDNYGASSSVWYKMKLPAGWDNTSSLTMALICAEGAILAPFSMLPGETYPPSASGLVNSWDSITDGDSDTFSVDPQGDDGYLYFGVGDFGTSAEFTFTWFVSLADPEGVSIALRADSLDASPLWTNLDSVATSWSIHRGKASEFDKTGTGIASISFADSTGLLDPTNTTSPFYNVGSDATLLDPMKQLSISMTNPVTGTAWMLFRGHLSSQQHDMDMWSDTRGLDTVDWEAADAFDLLAAIVLTPGVSGDAPPLADFSDVWYEGTPANFPEAADVFEHVDDRLVHLLDDANWPGTGAFDVLRDIFSGNCSLQGRVYDRTDQLLAAMFDAADAESVAIASIFMSKTGVVTFRGRFPPFFPTVPGYNVATWKAGGMPQALADPTVAPISGLQFRRTKDDIINSVIALPQNAEDADVAGAIVEDAGSIATFGYRGESFTDLQVSAGHTNATPTTGLEEAEKQAQYIVGNYAAPRTNVSVIQFRTRSPQDPTGPALWELVTEVEIGDRVQLETQHVGGGGFNEYFFVQGIRYEARGMTDEYPDITCELEVIAAAYYDFNPFGTVDGTA